MVDNQDSELKEIIEGFNLFGSETDGLINPKEALEIMDIMNMNEKNPFLYNIIQTLCSNEEIEQKGGINAKDFISLLDEGLEDISSTKGLEKIFSIFSDNDSKKISLPIFSQIINQNMELDLGNDGEKIKNLISKPEISGKEIDFDEFKDIINTGKEEKINYIYKKKPSNNSSNKMNKINENDNYNNSFKKNNENFLSGSEKEYAMNNNNHYEFKNISEDENIIKDDEININNFDNMNSKYELNNTKEDKNISKKKYRHMHESPKTNLKNLNYEEEKENNKDFDIKGESDIFDEKNNNINKEDKTEKRYHRRYRDIKSPPQKQKEEKSYNDNKIEENIDKKVSSGYYRYRGKK